MPYRTQSTRTVGYLSQVLVATVRIDIDFPRGTSDAIVLHLPSLILAIYTGTRNLRTSLTIMGRILRQFFVGAEDRMMRRLNEKLCFSVWHAKSVKLPEVYPMVHF